MPIATQPIDCCGEALLLTSERAVVWPRQSAVLIADWHLGKAEIFGARGMPIPAGSDAHDLERLAALVDRFAATSVYVLGDLMHAPPGPTALWPPLLASWLAERRSVHVHVVAGNHDRVVATDLPCGLGHRIDWHENALAVSPFVLDHEPGPRAEGYALAGHLHPVFRLQAGRDRTRAPAFWFRQDHAVLPAFGSFTGGMNIKPDSGERLFIAGPGSVIEVPV